MRLKSREKIKKKLLQKLQGITVLFQKQIKSYEKEFNNNRAIFPEVQETIGENAKLEMEKQLKNQKNLQSGVLFECNCATAIAKKLGLNIMTEGNSFSIPRRIKEHLKNNCKYIFYSETSKTVVYQYGCPNHKGDLEILYKNILFKIEIKDETAKLGEYDLNIDENYNISASDSLQHQIPSLAKKVNEMNINAYNNKGKNIKIDNNKEFCSSVAVDYFKKNQIDILVIREFKSNKIHFFTLNDIEKQDLFDFKGSEIRTTGRNGYKPNSRQLSNLIEEDEEGLVKINKTNTKEKKARGGNEISRISFGNFFFVKKKDIIFEDKEYYKVRKDKIKQSRPTVSIHIKYCPLSS